jgi:hypothetical protein
VSVPDHAPYVLPQDARYLDAWDELHHDQERLRICRDYPPEPFLGRHDSPLVLLQANPGLGPADSRTWACPEALLVLLPPACASVTDDEPTETSFPRKFLMSTHNWLMSSVF